MRSLIIFTLVFSFVSTSCKDKNKPQVSTCQQNPSACESVLTAKSFFLFNDGSWWVYEEENTGARDSVYVTESINTSGYDFDMRVYSTYQDYFYHYYPFFPTEHNGCSPSAPVNQKCLYITRSKGKPGDFVGDAYCFFVNYKVNDFTYVFNVYYENNKIIVKDIWDTYTLNNLNFDKTVKIHELNSYEEGQQPTNHYYSKNVGLIRKELLDSNQVWNLVSYHIE
jgi:hypothetical protein